MTSELTITLAQTAVSPNPEENLQTARRLLKEAATRGSDLIAFPEMFMARPQEGVPLAKVAQPLDGPFVKALSALAAEHGIAVVCGLWEAVPGEAKRAANVAIALGSDGSLLARYHKVHLFDALSVKESDLMQGGSTPPPLFTVKGMQMGLAICYDLRFPELFRDLALRGADAVVVPSAWYAGPLKEEHWLTLLQARAIENTMYVGGANLCGPPFAARSAVFDPFGVMLAGAGEGEALVSAQLNRGRIDEVRTKLPSLTHVRRDLFRS
jgi:predicted amidohydrolase